ncbi:MAG: hypothetical protein KatS3mg087_0740 [Patescibacteria group bacterium]|nr:MAG: hypothetical protein KatS3mg087_0740 [Patescibacteria group bacterium]
MLLFKLYGYITDIMIQYSCQINQEDKKVMSTKKLSRSRTNRMLAGVCGGIAEYFDVDPTIVRLAWIVFTFIGGSGILVYLICWVIIPQDV